MTNNVIEGGNTMETRQDKKLPKYRVKSLKRPYRTNKIGHTHDRWTVDIRNEEEDGSNYRTKFDGDYTKEQAKAKAKKAASPGERIEIQDKKGEILRVEVKE